MHDRVSQMHKSGALFREIRGPDFGSDEHQVDSGFVQKKKVV